MRFDLKGKPLFYCGRDKLIVYMGIVKEIYVPFPLPLDYEKAPRITFDFLAFRDYKRTKSINVANFKLVESGVIAYWDIKHLNL